MRSNGAPSGLQLINLLALLSFGVSLVCFILAWIPTIRRIFSCLLQRRFFVLACVTTLIALFYAEENWRGHHVWEQHKRAGEARGERFSLAELVPPPVPDAQNFAMTPLLKPLLDYTRVDGRVVWRDTNVFDRLRSVSAELGGGSKSTNQLSLGSMETGTLADLETCRAFYRGNTNYPPPATSGTAAVDILTALGKFDPELKELREAAASRPLARFPIEYDYKPASGILLPHLSFMKIFTVLTHVRATAELEAGRSVDAFADLKLGFRISDAMRDEPFLIDQLVRIATLSLNLQVVREGLARQAWTDAQLTELENYLASVDLLAEYKHGMHGERAMAVSVLDYLRRQGFQVDIEKEWTRHEGDGSSMPGAILMPGGWFYQNMLTISRMHQDLSLACVNENAHRVFPKSIQRLNLETAALVNGRFHPYQVFAAMLFPSLAQAILKAARMQTFVDATRVACGLERNRLANGKLPLKLEALVPRFIAAIPNDVMDGQPLRYRTTPEGGYVIYSIGWNAKDDGGEIVFSKSGKNVNAEEGDWVWRYPAK